MTRKKQINKAAEQFLADRPKGYFHTKSEENTAQTGFIMGAKWADEHPENPWISTEERLPNELVKDGERLYYSSEVFVRYEEIYEGQRSSTVKYDWDRVFFTTCKPEWQKHNYKKGMCQQVVTHWMPIPQIKKGE